MSVGIDVWLEKKHGIRRKNPQDKVSAPRPERDPPPIPSAEDLRSMGAGEPGVDAQEIAHRARAWFSEKAPRLPPAVVGRGDPQADVVVIGEAPAEEETRQGLPFVGPSGKLLERMLAAVKTKARPSGIRPAPGGGAWLTNSSFWTMPPGHVPSAAEIDGARPVVAALLEALRPKAILACGRTAAQLATAQPRSVGVLRGAWHEPALAISQWMPPEDLVPVLCTWHPAYLLREPGRKRQSWQDLKMLGEGLER